MDPTMRCACMQPKLHAPPACCMAADKHCCMAQACIACQTGIFTAALRQHSARVMHVGVLRKCCSCTTDLQGWTPLMSAISAGREAIAEYLLGLGADVSASNSGGQTALHYAASKGHIACLRLLVRAGAASNCKVGCLQIATTFAIHQHALPEIPPERKSRPLCCNFNCCASQGKQPTCMQRLIWLSCPDHHGNTPLHRAASAGKAEAARVLLEEGKAKLEDVDRRGQLKNQWSLVARWSCKRPVIDNLAEGYLLYPLSVPGILLVTHLVAWCRDVLVADSPVCGRGVWQPTRGAVSGSQGRQA
eukprot:366009-Chlamydomonas_euryale.AAC.7